MDTVFIGVKKLYTEQLAITEHFGGRQYCMFYNGIRLCYTAYQSNCHPKRLPRSLQQSRWNSPKPGNETGRVAVTRRLPDAFPQPLREPIAGPGSYP
jgi:hypothetical protein